MSNDVSKIETILKCIPCEIARIPGRIADPNFDSLSICRNKRDDFITHKLTVMAVSAVAMGVGLSMGTPVGLGAAAVGAAVIAVKSTHLIKAWKRGQFQRYLRGEIVGEE